MSVWQKVQNMFRQTGRPAFNPRIAQLSGRLALRAAEIKRKALYAAARKSLKRDPFRERVSGYRLKKMFKKQMKHARRRHRKVKNMRRRRKRKSRRGLFRRIFRSRNGWQKFLARKKIRLLNLHSRFIKPFHRPIKIAAAVTLLPMPFFYFRAWMNPDQLFPDPRTTPGLYAGGWGGKAPPPAWGSAYALQYLKRNEIPKPPIS